MKTFVFSKEHNYGGVMYPPESKVIVPDDRAASLEAAEVGQIEKVEKKTRKKKSDDD